MPLGRIPMINQTDHPDIRIFVLAREEDESGNSGTGFVACGVMFPTGQVVLSFNSSIHSLQFYNSIADCELVCGHSGKTRVVWVKDLALAENAR